ncbi:hypothetical protein BOTBODRAFT_101003 [Botryobasidium botryosum FD-172 SS1]|uniref:NAD(P)-binding protein n=1 Tax=Botryobasidium botryosum (strain FD-172 SS1) TaxID=930990 RepID=A0A067N9I4_BOTB1|nr:hypothetical protein BOTBODRAFT_101003 [Botryobasidium botryosum FD-172 SS1]
MVHRLLARLEQILGSPYAWSSIWATSALSLSIIPIFGLYYLSPLGRRSTLSPRQRAIPPRDERVLILGASSGIGASIARAYAERGARVGIVGRRIGELERVAEEIKPLQRVVKAKAKDGGSRILCLQGDFGEVEDLVRIRERVVLEWGGVDTLVIAAGVSTIQLLLALAGPGDRSNGGINAAGSQGCGIPSAEGVQNVKDVAAKAMHGNFVGPVISCVTFIPTLEETSPSPAILLLSSVASVIPAPTKTLYGATKAAAFTLFRSLAIEHPEIAFSSVLPASVEGDFRSRAVDANTNTSTRATESDQPLRKPEKKLGKDHVAHECVKAVDWGTRTMWLPRWYAWAHALYWIFPSVIERGARKKYDFQA